MLGESKIKYRCEYIHNIFNKYTNLKDNNNRYVHNIYTLVPDNNAISMLSKSKEVFYYRIHRDWSNITNILD